jgi:hypothetical protein
LQVGSDDIRALLMRLLDAVSLAAIFFARYFSIALTVILQT